MDILKSLHIIFMVSWFAGLFYIVRLFIYHVEAQEKETQVRTILSSQFVIMERKLWWIITTPAMVLTVVFGVWMLALNWDYYKQAPWMHIKLTFVVFLLIYHFICQKIMFQFHQNKFKWNSMRLRLWNEVATLFLVSIVFLVVLKDSFNWIKGVLGFFGVAIVLMIAIQWYKRLRKAN
jgi:putative membrane protein